MIDGIGSQFEIGAAVTALNTLEVLEPNGTEFTIARGEEGEVIAQGASGERLVKFKRRPAVVLEPGDFTERRSPSTGETDAELIARGVAPGLGAHRSAPARLTIKEALAILKISRAALYVRAADGRIKIVKDGARSFVLGDELARYLASQKADA